MKKTLLSMLLAVVGCMTALAGNPLKVVEGSMKDFKKDNGTVYASFNFEGAMWDNKKPLTEKYANLQALIPTAYEEFEDEFNKKAKNYTITANADEAKFRMDIKVTNMDNYYRVMGFGLPGFETKIWGTVTITNVADGTTIAVLEIDELDGGGNPIEDRSFVDAYDKLGNELGSKFQKGK